MAFTCVVYRVASVAKGLHEAFDGKDGLAEVCEGLGDGGGRDVGCEITTGFEDCRCVKTGEDI